MQPARTRHVLEKEELDRLDELCEILDRAPLERFDEAPAAALLGRAEILVTSWGCPPIDGAVLARAPKLRLVAHAAGTVKTLIKPGVFEAGIRVVSAADANALPVAEYTLAAILFANKRVLQFRRLYAETRGRRETTRLSDEPIGNYAKTIGIVGASRIGRRVLELLRPFDFKVLLYDPFVSAAEASALGVEQVELHDLMRRSEVVSLHAPSLPSTRHMIGAEALALMPDGATLINTARGALVDQAALEAELVSGRIEAVIDVTEPEVLAPGSPLYTLPNVLLTPHVAGALGTERRRLGRLVVEEVERFIRGEPLRHAIEPGLLERLA